MMSERLSKTDIFHKKNKRENKFLPVEVEIKKRGAKYSLFNSLLKRWNFGYRTTLKSNSSEFDQKIE